MSANAPMFNPIDEAALKYVQGLLGFIDQPPGLLYVHTYSPHIRVADQVFRHRTLSAFYAGA